LDRGGLEAGDPAHLPIATDQGVDQADFDDAIGAELDEVPLAEARQVGFVFSGDDAFSGVGAVFEGVETGRGLTLFGAGACRFLGVEAVGLGLSGGRHAFLLLIPLIRGKHRDRRPEISEVIEIIQKILSQIL